MLIDDLFKNHWKIKTNEISIHNIQSYITEC